MDGYDEDLIENPFYSAFRNKSKGLYEEAAIQRWTICIPRKRTTSRAHYNLNNFQTHILKPVDGESNIYVTDNNKEVQINGDFMVTRKGFSDIRSVRILFEETFFNPKEESYHVLCIDQPLEGGAFTATTEPVFQNLETLQNCIEFLWSGTGRRRGRQQIDEIVELFNSTYQRLETESIRHTMDAANAVFTRAMQTALKETHLRRPALGSKAFMDNIKVAIETYVMHGLYKRIFKGLSSFLAKEDADLNKITRNLADLQVRDLGVKQQLCKNIPKAKKVLAKLNKFATPLEKLYVLKLTVTALSESQDIKDADTSEPITADDLLPVLVFLVAKSEIPNWLANLTYMHNFHFSRCKSDEFQFYLSSIEAAVEYVRSERLNDILELSHTQRQEIVSELFQRIDSTENKAHGPSPVETLFEFARLGKASEIVTILKRNLPSGKPISDEMCHPLCSCDNCEKLIASKRTDPNAVTVFSRDNIGCTALHAAAEFGHYEVVFELIKLGAVIGATNYHGSTSIHSACQRGHKNVAIMLLHYGADLNTADNDGNTPLHLAVANGHEEVTDAVLLCSPIEGKKVDVNAANENGDTPLHIAARWGFSHLVKTLLEGGASGEARNKNKETPSQCALNSKVQELLQQQPVIEEDKGEGYIFIPAGEYSKGVDLRFSDTIKPDAYVTKSYSRQAKKRKECEGLLRTVADGDVEMVRLKLGLLREEDEEAVDDPDAVTAEIKLCHPLCFCVKCSQLQKITISESITLTANSCNDDGVCPLHIAAVHGYGRIVSLLLKKAAANPNIKTKANQRTPLHLACQYNHAECVSSLLKHGAKPNLKDSSGNTPLHFCCTNGHIGPALLLLQAEANVNLANHRGNSPLHDSARWNFVDLVVLLLHYGASVKARNLMQLTPLQYAQHDEVVEVLAKAERATEDVSSEIPILHNKIAQQSQTARSQHGSPNRTALFIASQPGSPVRTTLFSLSQSGSPVRTALFTDSPHGSPVSTALLIDSMNESVDAFKDTTSGNSLPVKTTAESSDNTPSTSITDRLKDNHDPTPEIQRPNPNLDDRYNMKHPPLERRNRRNTVNDLFEALESDDIKRLRAIADSIRNFNGRTSLKRVNTIDRSEAKLDPHSIQLLSIRHFKFDSLRHVETEDKSRPNTHELSKPSLHIQDERNGENADNTFVPS